MKDIKNNKKPFWVGFRARESISNPETSTPTKRITGVSTDTKSLAINTTRKSQAQIITSNESALKKVNRLKSRYITSNEEMNCAYLWHTLGNDLLTLQNIQIPQSILSPTYTKETIIVAHQHTAPKRKSAKSVMRSTAKQNFQKALAVIMRSNEISDSDKNKFNCFLQMFDINNPENKKIPSAEWCHMIAMSLSTNSSSAMAADNLFAATAMVNTKMINFENSAKRLAQDGYTVKLQTEHATFIGTATLARLTQILIVSDQLGKEYRFTQTINPFEVNETHLSTSRQDPRHVYNYISDWINAQDSTRRSRKRTMLFSPDNPEQGAIKFDPDNIIGKTTASKAPRSKRPRF